MTEVETVLVVHVAIDDLAELIGALVPGARDVPSAGVGDVRGDESEE